MENEKTVLESCRACPRWKEVKRQMAVAGILSDAIDQFRKKLTDKNFQPTVAEFLKLVQIEQDLENELNPPEEIRVRWINPVEKS